MRLRLSFTSPFARKVRLAASYLGIPLEFEVADTMSETDTLRIQNPLGKLPVLLVEGQKPIFDSPVILTYLDHVAGGGRIVPADFDKKLASMRLEALGDGMMDASLMVFYEVRYRPEERRHADWVALQRAKIARALDALEAEPPVFDGTVTSGLISVACALAYIDLRVGREWRDTHPKMVAWLDDFSARVPAFAETAPPA